MGRKACLCAPCGTGVLYLLGLRLNAWSGTVPVPTVGETWTFGVSPGNAASVLRKIRSPQIEHLMPCSDKRAIPSPKTFEQRDAYVG